jgi:type II secretory pathway component PulM
MAVQAQQVTVTLNNAAPDVLAQWLAVARQNARMAPKDAHLKRNAKGGWDGTLALQLPGV